MKTNNWKRKKKTIKKRKKKETNKKFDKINVPGEKLTRKAHIPAHTPRLYPI